MDHMKWDETKQDVTYARPVPEATAEKEVPQRSLDVIYYLTVPGHTPIGRPAYPHTAKYFPCGVWKAHTPFSPPTPKVGLNAHKVCIIVLLWVFGLFERKGQAHLSLFLT